MIGRERKVFNKFYINIVPTLKISIIMVMIMISSPLMTKLQMLSKLQTFRNHPSIMIIPKKKNGQSFSLAHVTYDILKKSKNSWCCKSVSAVWYSNWNFKTKFRLFCRIFLWKYQPVYLKIDILTGFEISWCNPSL